QAPDHQVGGNSGLMREAFADSTRTDSLIFELLDMKYDVTDEGSAVWFLQDLATEQDAEGGMDVKLQM
ncbi:hypothetical protein Drorol1_Dr00023633, partial [Drosera rotundifolia]